MSEEYPLKIQQALARVQQQMIPAASSPQYANAYEKYIKWKEQFNITSDDEPIVLAYLENLSRNYAPTTVWSAYSMIKSKLNQLKNHNIANYKQVAAFLKRNSTGYQQKQAKIFTNEDIEKFFKNAPDSVYLDLKVMTVFGLKGACRKSEMIQLKTSDLQDKDIIIVVKLRKEITKNRQGRSFVIDGDYCKIVNKYQKLRPENYCEGRFFIRYDKSSGKCVRQVIGEHTFNKAPKTIAAFLGLPDADAYTGHSFRRTSATMICDAGADVIALQRHGGWKSATVAMRYVDESLRNKRQAAQLVTSGINLNTAKDIPSRGKTPPPPLPPPPSRPVEAAGISEEQQNHQEEQTILMSSLEVFPDDCKSDLSDFEDILEEVQNHLNDQSVAKMEKKQNSQTKNCKDGHLSDNSFDAVILTLELPTLNKRSPLKESNNQDKPPPKKPKTEQEPTTVSYNYYYNYCHFHIHKRTAKKRVI